MSNVQLVQVAGQDEILAGLVRLAQEAQLQAPLTLMVSGGMVRGVLIGRDAWLAELAGLLARSGEAGQGLARQLGELDLADQLTDQLTDGPDRRAVHHHVHLRQARFGPARMLQGDGPGLLWRGRLSEVSGWAFGNG